MTPLFDVLLAVSLLGTAAFALGTRHLVRAVILLVLFGLLMSLAWAWLDAPDVAMAEAAVGAGITGALLFDAFGAVERSRRGGP